MAGVRRFGEIEEDNIVSVKEMVAGSRQKEEDVGRVMVGVGVGVKGVELGGVVGGTILQKFKLYETHSKFYMIGRNKGETVYRVLKIDRLEPSEMSIREDPTTYSKEECDDLLKRVDEGNKSTGGLKCVTICYGIVGFIKFLGPYYMLLITKRRKIGAICGHTIYGVAKSEIIPIPNPDVRSNMDYSKNENRYKKLLCTVDLTKDFFFSYSYHVMRSLQKNVSDGETRGVPYEIMFVWNEFLTRGIRNHLKNTLWTVALVYGFFKQSTFTVSGRDVRLTLISRRSRHYAGTRYLKRGVNEKGRVANDVETEQIVSEDVDEGCPVQVTSVVQNRGSIPLFWSQETSRLNIRPDIILLKKDQDYEATRLHFQNLTNRYGNPIIILNLIKTRERKPRESILRAEFAKAIEVINKDFSEENRLRFLHWDLHKHCRSKSPNVLALLGKVAEYALNLTGFFQCEVTRKLITPGSLDGPHFETVEDGESCLQCDDKSAIMENLEIFHGKDNSNGGNITNHFMKSSMLQNGVLRTNCIDCLDRTNVAQFAYGLAALGHQLFTLGFIDSPKLDIDTDASDELMRLYEKMGDTLAFQYGGSAAHNKIFSERRGQWKAASQSQEFFRTIQRYYSNAYMDADKQDAINIFLGYFQPQLGKPALWQLDSDQHYNVGKNAQADDSSRSIYKRSLSDGNILFESRTSSPTINIGQRKIADPSVAEMTDGDCKGLCDSTPEISTCESDLSYARYTPSMTSKQLFADIHTNLTYFNEDTSNCSNFVDLDWLSSSGNSCEEEVYERSTLLNSPNAGTSTENVVDGIAIEATPGEDGSSIKGKGQAEIELAYPSKQELEALGEFSESFVNWVNYGEALCR